MTKINLTKLKTNFIVNYQNLTPTDSYDNLEKSNIDKGSVSEILCVGFLSEIHYSKLLSILEHWYEYMSPGGELLITDKDYDIISNNIANNILDLEQINKVLYGDNSKSIYNIANISTVLMSVGFIIDEMSYNGIYFNVTAKKPDTSD